MRRIFTALFGLLAIASTSCTKEEVPALGTTGPVGEKIIVTAYVGGNDTRVSSSFDDVDKKYTFTWEDEDAFSVIGNSENQSFTKANTGDNNFTGIAPVAKEGKYYAIYPATTAKDHTVATFDISNQSNGAAYVLYSSTEDISTFEFKHAMAYLHLNLTFPSTPQSSTCDITIFTPSGLPTDGTINLTNGKIAENQNGKHVIEVKNHEVGTPVLVAIPPMAKGTALTFSVKCGDGLYYGGNLTSKNENGIVAGNYYDATVELEGEVPYVTFRAAGEQAVKYYGDDLEYSYDGNDWDALTSTYVEFGGETKVVYVRAKSDDNDETIDNIDGTLYRTFIFKNDAKVVCTGDIRTLIDGAKYKTVETGNAQFKQLFMNCTVLTSAPDLPATTLADYCYQIMFKGCTSLMSAPALPATKLANFCYNSMFEGCTSLTTAPELPAETLAGSCYYHMFSGCTSLTTAPELPAKTLAQSCYSYMFSNCTSLTSAPVLPAEELETSCYTGMFSGCTSLTSAPVLGATTLAKNCYGAMFENCTNISAAPELDVTTLAQSCYMNMFKGCTSLTSAPELPATAMQNGCYQGMFSGCTSLTTAPELPAETVAQYCYKGMFSGCTSLTTAPNLPAKQLMHTCYQDMFNGCSKLSYIKALCTDMSAYGCVTDWVKGVASTGTFVKNTAATSWTNGFSGIPAGWSVETAEN